MVVKIQTTKDTIVQFTSMYIFYFTSHNMINNYGSGYRTVFLHERESGEILG